MAMSKSLRRRPEARAGYKAGYAWAESGRSLNDLEIAMDCATREFPDTPEGWGQEGALYDKMRNEVFDEGELDELEAQSDDYQAGWWDGVAAASIELLRRERQ